MKNVCVCVCVYIYIYIYIYIYRYSVVHVLFTAYDKNQEISPLMYGTQGPKAIKRKNPPLVYGIQGPKKHVL